MARVLTLAGRNINWHKPPSPTTKVLWSQRTTSGQKVTGSLRTICAIDRLNNLAIAQFGRGIIIYQPPYNTGVAASKGTHNLDACIDAWIPGVPPLVQQRFFRVNGAGDFFRTPAEGFTPHQHMFILPPVSHQDVSRRWQMSGFKVGEFVDGGWSTSGHLESSSQIHDYYTSRDALIDHSYDGSWHPANIDATVFNLHAYIVRHAKIQAAAKAA